LVKPVVRAPESNDGLRYVGEVSLSSPEGTDKYNGYQPTSTITVLTDYEGNLVTATPGKIK